MKTYIRRREENDQLVVMFGGWGTDENVFVPFCNDEFDFILFNNYSADDALVLPETKTYRKITLIGWSIGVWAAEYLSPKTGIFPDVTIAVNGTPVPADDNYGISQKTFEDILDNISEGNMENFYIRMYGDKDTFEKNKERIPGRSVKSLSDELRWLYNRIMEQKEPGFRWDYAVQSKVDRVFPSENVKSYWEKQQSTIHLIVPYPHFPFHMWKSYSEFIDFVEKKGKSKSKKK